MRRTSGSEFPNDNPLLHCGAIWVLATPCGALESIPPPEDAHPPIEAAPDTTESPADDHRREEPTDVEDTPVDTPPVMVQSDAWETERRHDTEQPPASGIVEQPDPLRAEQPAADEQPLEQPGAAARLEEPTKQLGEAAQASDPFEEFVAAMVAVAVVQGGPALAVVVPRLLEPAPVEIDAIEPASLDQLVDSGWVTRAADLAAPSDHLASLVRGWQCVLRTGDLSACGVSMLNEWAADFLAALLAAPQRAPALSYELRRRGVAAFGMVKLAA